VQANVWKYYAFHLFLNLQLWFPIWIIYLTRDRGFTLAQVTLIDIPFWLCIILLQIPGAALADRFGRKPVLCGAAIAFTVAITAFGLATTFWGILLAYLVWGIGFSLFWGTESAFIFDSLKAMGRESEYPRIYGRCWAVATTAQVAGTLLGAPLASATNLATPIIASGAISACALLVGLTFSEPHVRDTSRPVQTYGQIINDSGRLVRDNPAVRYAILYFGLITIGSIAVVFFFQPFLENHQVDLGEVGIWQTPMRLAGIVAALAAHRLMRDLGERRTFYAMPLLVVGGYLTLAAWDSVYAQIAFPLINFAVILSQPTVTDYLNRRVPSEQRATVVSLTNLIRSIVLIPSAPLLGLLADKASDQAAFWTGGAIVAALGLPLLLLWLPHLGGRAEREPIPEVAAAEP
jgi:predicted MFS family arabinose efflux permease